MNVRKLGNFVWYTLGLLAFICFCSLFIPSTNADPGQANQLQQEEVSKPLAPAREVYEFTVTKAQEFFYALLTTIVIIFLALLGLIGFVTRKGISIFGGITSKGSSIYSSSAGEGHHKALEAGAYTLASISRQENQPDPALDKGDVIDLKLLK